MVTTLWISKKPRTVHFKKIKKQTVNKGNKRKPSMVSYELDTEKSEIFKKERLMKDMNTALRTLKSCRTIYIYVCIVPIY